MLHFWYFITACSISCLMNLHMQPVTLHHNSQCRGEKKGSLPVFSMIVFWRILDWPSLGGFLRYAWPVPDLTTKI